MLKYFMLNKFVIALFYLTVNFSAYSQGYASDNLKIVLEQLHIEIVDCYQELVVEKILPYAKNKSVIVIPKIVDQGEGFVTLDSYLVVIDNRSGKILNVFYESEAWTSDAVVLESIVIDFAPYKLNSTVRAFGIRTKYSGSSRPNPYSGEYISLFYPNSGKLIRVLNEFAVYSYSGEWDTNCAGEFYSEEKTLVMSEQKTNNLNNIILKISNTTIANAFVNQDCIDEERVVKKTEVLKFDGVEYK